jgi:hypothetical protein
MAKVKFAWGPGMTARKCNNIVAHTKPARYAVARQAEELHIRASSKLSAHHSEGDAKVTLSHGKLDWYVNLDDKGHSARSGAAAWAIEFGHIAADGTFVEGAHILTGSI